MNIYKVTVPENKNTFFLEFLETIGAKYVKKNVNKFTLSKEQMNILDSQDDLNESDFFDSDSFIDELKKQNGLQN
jgi:hypothetical protein